jgi:hypothetical protein
MCTFEKILGVAVLTWTIFIAVPTIKAWLG